MAAGNNKTRCITCDKEKRTVRCEGCLQLFCYDHLTDHRQELNKQLDHIQLNRDVFRQTLNEQMNHPQIHLLVKQINTWELDSIKIIQQKANECRQLLIEHRNEHFNQIELNLNKLTDELRDIRQENDFNEIDLHQFNDKLKKLTEELEKLSNFSFEQDSTPLIHKVSVVVSSSVAIAENVSSTKSISNSTKWKHNGSTIAGGYGEGSQSNQLYWPYGIFVDEDDQMIYVADYGNDRVVKWKHGAYYGQVVAGGNGRGTRKDQLNLPTDIILDKKNDSFIICDYGNRRVVRWPRRPNKNQQTIISHVACSRLAMDNNGDLYVSDWEKNEVRRWTKGDTNGALVAGGNGKGDELNQLNSPGYIFVDDEYSVYVSDSNNNRVMKWSKGAKEGIVVAGGHGEGNNPTQLSHPQGIIVDHLGNIYVADSGNDRIMRWTEGSREGSIVVGGNGQGKQPNQFNYPDGLKLDQQGNLYVVDWGNNRVQRFVLDVD